MVGHRGPSQMNQRYEVMPLLSSRHLLIQQARDELNTVIILIKVIIEVI